MWKNNNDKILATLCESLLNRNLYQIDLNKTPFTTEELNLSLSKVKNELQLTDNELKYFVFSESITNNAYSPKKDKINLLFKDGSIKDIAKASDQLNIRYLSEEVKKHFLCSPKAAMINNLKKKI